MYFCWKVFSVESSKSKDTLSLSPYVLFGAESLDLPFLKLVADCISSFFYSLEMDTLRSVWLVGPLVHVQLWLLEDQESQSLLVLSCKCC